MAYAHQQDEAAAAHEQANRDRLRNFARMLDSAVRIPGTPITLGWDAALSLVPGIGDAAGAVISLYLIQEARRRGLPARKIARMAGHVGIDALLGAIPIIGTIFDVFYQANNRNLRIIEEHLDGEPPATSNA